MSFKAYLNALVPVLWEIHILSIYLNVQYDTTHNLGTHYTSFEVFECNSARLVGYTFVACTATEKYASNVFDPMHCLCLVNFK